MQNNMNLFEKRFDDTLYPFLGEPNSRAVTRYLLSIIYPALEELQALKDERGALCREIYSRTDPKPGEELTEALLRLIGKEHDSATGDSRDQS